MRKCLIFCVLLASGCGPGNSIRPDDRSWSGGEVEVIPFREGDERGIQLSGKWPGASPGLWIRYELSLVQDGASDVFLLSGSTLLERFERYGTGVGDYSESGSFQAFDPGKPYRAVLDYEIWQGQPDKSQLLTKQSTYSELIRVDQKQN